MNKSGDNMFTNELMTFEKTNKNLILLRKLIVICLPLTLILFILFATEIQRHDKYKRSKIEHYYTYDDGLYSGLLAASVAGIVLVYLYNTFFKTGLHQYHHLTKSSEIKNSKLYVKEPFALTFDPIIDNYESLIYLPFTNKPKGQLVYIFVFLLFIIVAIYLKIYLNLLTWYQFKNI